MSLRKASHWRPPRLPRRSSLNRRKEAQLVVKTQAPASHAAFSRDIRVRGGVPGNQTPP